MKLPQKLGWSSVLIAASAIAATDSIRAAPAAIQKIEAGSRVAQETNKGNCLACHAMPTDPRAVTSANIGPPLSSIKARFPDREVLRRHIWDAEAINPDTVMPPFGKNHILTGDEIELVIDYLYTL
jgi:L-cysteine S-thiosulfotransferase